MLVAGGRGYISGANIHKFANVHSRQTYFVTMCNEADSETKMTLKFSSFVAIVHVVYTYTYFFLSVLKGVDCGRLLPPTNHRQKFRTRDTTRDYAQQPEH